MGEGAMKNRLTRKTFLLRSLAGLGAFFGLSWGTKAILNPVKLTIKGRILGANHQIGHLLRDLSIPKKGDEKQSEEIIEVPILIVGTGIAGLSAAWKLHKSGHKNFLLVDLEDHIGGNADAGRNEATSYPWAAHYLPIPNNEDQELLTFLEEQNIITGYNSEGLPIYNEYHLCQSPQERLFLKGRWQEGLIPNYGISERDIKQISDFLALMNQYRQEKGSDGRWAFDIPLALASEDEIYQKLDTISMTDFLSQHHFDSEYLLWYVNYCCRDDYGVTSANTSAYAGIHYFAARRGKADNAESNAVLTWAEGNNFLAKALSNDFKDKIRTKTLVTQVNWNNDGVEATAYDWNKNVSVKIKAQRVILATPQFVNQRILPKESIQISTDSFQYAPWLVANITVNQMPIERDGFLCWDNVAYNSNSLGYISATHQQVSREIDKWVLTYYLPLSHKSPVEARKEAIKKTYEEWTEEILTDLESFHPNIRETIEEINLKIWGHGMIAPTLGFLSSENRKLASKNIDNRIFFAHSDLSGVSIFEESFYQGNRVANEILPYLSIS